MVPMNDIRILMHVYVRIVIDTYHILGNQEEKMQYNLFAVYLYEWYIFVRNPQS